MIFAILYVLLLSYSDNMYVPRLYYIEVLKTLYISDLSHIPDSVCEIFDDHDDNMWCFMKLCSDVMDKNAQVKKKVLKKHLSFI